MKILSILCFCLLLSGCVSTQVTFLSDKSYPPLQPEDVVIYLNEEDIPGDYEKIAVLHAQGESDMTNEKQMINALRKSAAKIGCNGIFFPDIQEASSGAKVAAAIFGTMTYRRGEAVAIYVLSREEPAASPQP